MVKIVNYIYWLINPSDRIVAYAVYSEDDNALAMVCPCKETITKLLGKHSWNYYLAKVWEDGAGS